MKATHLSRFCCSSAESRLPFTHVVLGIYLDVQHVVGSLSVARGASSPEHPVPTSDMRDTPPRNTHKTAKVALLSL